MSIKVEDSIQDLKVQNLLFTELEKILNYNCRTLPLRGVLPEILEGSSLPKLKKRFGNSFQPTIDAPPLIPHYSCIIAPRAKMIIIIN
jgi:hypothetical protein